MSIIVNDGQADQSWHVIYTRHQHEKTVAQILSSKGFEVFLPLFAAVHRWKDRDKRLLLPLFPCYVFLKGGLDRRQDIVTTPGMYAFVGPQNRAAVIPTEEIDAVRRAAESSLRIEPHPFLKCGDHVRVKSGPLEGVEGILTRKKNLYRLVLSVELLRQAVALEIDAHLVEKVSSQITPTQSHWGPADERNRPSAYFV
jgi:transcription antitermination factor NusG